MTPNGLYLYLAEVYVKNPATGEGGWDITHVWVWAKDRAAARARVEKETPNFDEVINIGGWCGNVEPLCYCAAIVLGAERVTVPALDSKSLL